MYPDHAGHRTKKDMVLQCSTVQHLQTHYIARDFLSYLSVMGHIMIPTWLETRSTGALDADATNILTPHGKVESSRRVGVQAQNKNLHCSSHNINEVSGVM